MEDDTASSRQRGEGNEVQAEDSRTWSCEVDGACGWSLESKRERSVCDGVLPGTRWHSRKDRW